MAGTLYIVATPIGNLDDMPPRVAATFGAADFIAAEDTRVTMKLLNFLGLKKPMVSYYEHALGGYESLRVRRIRPGDDTLYAPHASRCTYAWPRSFYLTISYRF